MNGQRESNRIFPVAADLLAVPLLIALFDASRWPFVHDAPLIHYVVFLIQNGFVPYRDIVDMNMPGAYILESFGMRTFGGGAHGWFLWDLLCDAAVVLASAWIAGRGRRAAGLIAGSLACLIHLSDGAVNLGQRDWTAAALLAISFGCLFRVLRGASARWSSSGFFFAAAFFAVVALSIKPSLLCFVLLAAGLVAWMHRGSPARLLPLALWGLLGATLPAVGVVWFLMRWHAVAAFVNTLTTLVPYYTSLQRASLADLLWYSLGPIQKLTCALAIVALVLFLANRSWRSMESNLILLAALCGVLHYVVQDKGWAYQRYPALVFVTLWTVLEIEKELSSHDARRWIAWPALGALIVILPAAAVARERLKPYSTAKMLHLESDLRRLGTDQLSHRVQCLDMTHGDCINVLYRLKLVQSTGFIYDYYLFPEKPTPLTAELQNRFLTMVEANPPEVFILSEQAWPASAAGYKKIARWPLFDDYLANHYRRASQYSSSSPGIEGYRIYLWQPMGHPASP